LILSSGSKRTWARRRSRTFFLIAGKPPKRSEHFASASITWRRSTARSIGMRRSLPETIRARHDRRAGELHIAEPDRDHGRSIAAAEVCSTRSGRKGWRVGWTARRSIAASQSYPARTFFFFWYPKHLSTGEMTWREHRKLFTTSARFA